MAFSFELD